MSSGDESLLRFSFEGGKLIDGHFVRDADLQTREGEGKVENEGEEEEDEDSALPLQADQEEDGPSEAEPPHEHMVPELSSGMDEEISGDYGGPSDFTANMMKYMTGALDANPGESPSRQPPPPTVEDATDEDKGEHCPDNQVSSQRQGKAKAKSEKMSTTGPKTRDEVGEMMAAFAEETKRLTEVRIADETQKALLRAEIDSQRKEIDHLQREAEKCWRDQSLIAADEEERHVHELRDKGMEVATLKNELERLHVEFQKARDLQILAAADERGRSHRDLQAKLMQVAALKKELRQAHVETDQIQRDLTDTLEEERKRHKGELDARNVELEAFKKEKEQSCETDKTHQTPSRSTCESEHHCGDEKTLDKQKAEIEALKEQLAHHKAKAETGQEHSSQREPLGEEKDGCDYKSTVRKQHMEIAELKEEVERNKAEVEATRQSHAKGKAEQDHCHEQEMHAQIIEMGGMKKEIEDLRAEIECRDEQLEDKDLELEALTNDMEVLKVETRKIFGMQLISIEMRENHRREMEAKGQKISVLEKELAQVGEELAAKTVDEPMRDLRQEVERKDAEIASLKEETKRLREARGSDSATEDAKHLTEQLDKKAAEIAELKHEREFSKGAETDNSVGEELRRHKQELEVKDLEISRLQKQVKDVKEEADTMQQEHKVFAAGDEQRCREQLQRKDVKINALKHDIKHLQATFERAEYQQIVLAGEESLRHRQIMAGHASQIADLKRQIKRFRSEGNQSKQQATEATQRSIQRAVAEALSAAEDKHSEEMENMRGRLRSSQRARAALESDHHRLNDDLDARVMAATKPREEAWTSKYDSLKKERDFMAKVLMHQWGKEELGSGNPQGYRYKFARKSG